MSIAGDAARRALIARIDSFIDKAIKESEDLIKMKWSKQDYHDGRIDALEELKVEIQKEIKQ